jgi:hypothetical protein
VKVTNEAAKELAKDKSVWIGRVRHYLEERTSAERSPDRRQDIIHPSELCRDDFCPRAVWYRIMGYPALTRHIDGFHLINIWDEGTDIHTKWQTRLWDMGLLTGEFSCLACSAKWWAKAPASCRFCGRERPLLRYLEVPVDGSEYLISGRADARVGLDLGEFKSIGEGTLRLEAPVHYARYTRKVLVDGEEKEWTDLKAIWRAVRMPFLVHRKQAMLYLHFTGLDRMIFIYESKWNQQIKEFVVDYKEDEVLPMLELCKDVMYALEQGKPPYCPHGGCALCRAYEEEPKIDEDERPIVTTRSSNAGVKVRARKIRLPVTR